MEARKLSPSQAAELLDISKRTLRRWCSSFPNALSESAGRKGRKRFFDGDDIQTLQRAKDMLAEGMTLERIAEVLPVRTADEKVTALTLSTEASMMIGTVAERTRVIGDQIETIEDRLNRFEKWSRLPWWKRIFKKPE